MSETINRAELARELGVSLPTIDDWVRRGCPVVSKGEKGRPAKFSLSEVRAWRMKDVARRSYNREELRILRDSGQEHLNHLRLRVEDSVRHFLWYSFTIASRVLLRDLVEDRGMSEVEAKKMICLFYIYWSHIYEKWLTEDAYNQALKESSGQDLDDEFHDFTLGCYKATSFPPSNFDINKDIQIPEFFHGFMNDWVAAKKADQLEMVAPRPN